MYFFTHDIFVKCGFI